MCRLFGMFVTSRLSAESLEFSVRRWAADTELVQNQCLEIKDTSAGDMITGWTHCLCEQRVCERCNISLFILASMLAGRSRHAGWLARLERVSSEAASPDLESRILTVARQQLSTKIELKTTWRQSHRHHTSPSVSVRSSSSAEHRTIVTSLLVSVQEQLTQPSFCLYGCIYVVILRNTRVLTCDVDLMTHLLWRAVNTESPWSSRTETQKRNLQTRNSSTDSVNTHL